MSRSQIRVMRMVKFLHGSLGNFAGDGFASKTATQGPDDIVFVLSPPLACDYSPTLGRGSSELDAMFICPASALHVINDKLRGSVPRF